MLPNFPHRAKSSKTSVTFHETVHSRQRASFIYFLSQRGNNDMQRNIGKVIDEIFMSDIIVTIEINLSF